MGSLTITRHDKFECYSQLLEYMYYAQAVKLSHFDWVASLDMLNIFLNMLSIFLNMLSIFLNGLYTSSGNFNYFTCVVLFSVI